MHRNEVMAKVAREAANQSPEVPEAELAQARREFLPSCEAAYRDHAISQLVALPG